MSKKISIITLIASAIIFIIGVILVNLNLGRLGVIGFTGYTLCTLSIIAVAFRGAIIIATIGEGKRNEK